MSKIKKAIKSPDTQIAMATGVSIIVLAWFSKKVFTEPIGYLPLAVPPFVATIYEAVKKKHKDSRFLKTWYWVVAIMAATALVLALNWN